MSAKSPYWQWTTISRDDATKVCDNQFGPLSEGKQAAGKPPYAQAVRKQCASKAQGDGWPPEKHSRIISTVYSSEFSEPITPP
jgi:hypothetical protein